MNYNFDTIIDRKALGALKWKNMPEGTIAMSVADMDFALAPEIIAAVTERVSLGESGYVGMSEDDFGAVINWCKLRNGVEIPREHLIATPGVLYAARTALYSLTEPGDKVIVQPPLHTPSITSASMLGRIPLLNKLIYENGTYKIDFDHLEACFKDGAKVLMMCVPNNPTGRVWTKEELLCVAELVNRYNAYLITDEIHRDIIWGGNHHISPSVLPELADRTVALFSTSKSFNMGAFHIGSAIIPNEEIRDKVVKRFYAHGHVCNRPALMCIAAQTAAYKYGNDWFTQMMNYVEGNFKLANEYLSDLPIHPNSPEGTFLMWADITELKFDAATLKDVMRNKWRVVCDPGSYYDSADYESYTGLEHHARLNRATPRPQLEEALSRIRRYFKQ